MVARAVMGLLALSVTLPAQVSGQSTGNPTLLKPRELTEEEDTRRRTAVVQAVEKAADAVINVYVKVGEIPRTDLPFAQGSSFVLEGQGSGVIIDRSGLAITNWHVVASATEESGEQKLDHKVEITLNDETKYDASVLSTDKAHDLALLKIEVPDGTQLHAVEIGDSDSLLLGESVIAIGNPFGQANSVSMGILSATGREVRVPTPDGLNRTYKDLLQIDAAINPGNSGGALIDINGKLIGINNVKSSLLSGISFAIPVSTVRTVFMDNLVSIDGLRGVYVGMSVRDEDAGVMIAEVEPDSPAARSGIRVGDRLLRAGGIRVATSVDFNRAMLEANAGTDLNIAVERDGQELSFAPRPLSNAAYGVVRRTGIELELVAFGQEPDAILSASIELQREISGSASAEPSEIMASCLRVTHIRPDSSGQAAGVQKGDLLLGVEVVVPGVGFDTVEIKKYENLDQIGESFDELAENEDATYDCLLLRDGRIIRRSLEILDLP